MITEKNTEMDMKIIISWKPGQKATVNLVRLISQVSNSGPLVAV